MEGYYYFACKVNNEEGTFYLKKNVQQAKTKQKHLDNSI